MLAEKYKNQSANLVSYDYTDVADGTGKLLLYPFVARTTAAVYLMDSNLHYSESISTTGTIGATSAATERFNQTFSMAAFNTPRIVGGTALFTLPTFIKTSISDQVLNGYWIVTIYKYSGGVQTSIATITSLTTTTAAGADLNKIMVIQLDVPNTSFKIGDILQVKLQAYLWQSSGSANAKTWEVGHDPIGRNGTYLNSTYNQITKAVFEIPFRIDT